MTESQEHKAHMALLNKMLEDIKQEARAKHHIESVEAVRKYNLPYRVYLKQEYEENEIHINPFYPFLLYPLLIGGIFYKCSILGKIICNL